jgi:glutaconate CoA-transferase subunit B
MEPHPHSKELTVTSLHPGVTIQQVTEATGWDVAFALNLAETAPPTAPELDALRDLQRRTEIAHAG